MKEEYFFLHGRNKKETKKDVENKDEVKNEDDDYRDPIDMPENRIYHTRNNFSLKEQREMLDSGIHMDIMDDISPIEDDEEEKKEAVVKPISKKERILKEIQDPEYYGDPLEDSDNRKMYHAYDNFSKKQQEDMIVSEGIHIDTMDDIKPIEDEVEDKPRNKVEENEAKVDEVKIEDIKPDRIVFVDMADKITGISEDFARTETSDKKPANFLDRIKNVFGNAINYDVKFARQRSIAEKAIYENEDLFANNEKKKDKKATEKERNALLERVDKGFLLEGETLDDLEEYAQNEIKDAIKIYVFTPGDSCEAKLKDSIFEIMSDVFEEDIKANEKLAKAFKIDIKKILATKYASNILDLARKIKDETKELRYKDQNAVLKRIEEIEIKKANVFGGQLTTEKLGKIEGALDKALRKAPILSSLDYVAVSVGTILATTVAKSAATSLTAGVGGIALGTTISGIKESRKIEKDRAQVARETAIGYEASMYDEKIKDLKELAKLAEEALKKSGKKEEIINEIKKLNGTGIEESDTFIDIYLKMSELNIDGYKDISKIMKEIDFICKEYYKGKKSKEYKEINDEIDKIKKESRMREVMRQFTYEQRPAKELNEFLNIEEGELTPEGFRFVFGNLLDAISRQSLSASYRIDLIEYTDQDEVEQERTLLALNIANTKVRLRKQFDSLSEEDKKKIFANEYENVKDKDFNYVLNKYVNSKIEDFKIQKDRIDDGYKKYKKSQVTKRVLTTAGTSAVFSIAAQEIGALFDDKTYGLLERALDKGTGMNGPQKQTMLDYLAGGLLEKGKITTTDNLDQAYRMLDGALGRDGVRIEQVLDRGGLHMNNNTQAFDLNELKFDISKSGEKIVASMRRMVGGGSFREGVSINPSDKNLVFKLLISLSEDSKNTPISIPFDASGNLTFSDSLRFIFGNNGEFLGKYAEVAAYDKAGNILGIMATHVGNGISGSTAINTITKFTNPEFFGTFVPTYRKPLERAEKHKQEIERKPSNILKKKEVVAEPTIETIEPVIENTPIERATEDIDPVTKKVGETIVPDKPTPAVDVVEEPVTPVVVETITEKEDVVAEPSIEPVTVVKETIEPIVSEIVPEEKEVIVDNKKTETIEEKDKDVENFSKFISNILDKSASYSLVIPIKRSDSFDLDKKGIDGIPKKIMEIIRKSKNVNTLSNLLNKVSKEDQLIRYKFNIDHKNKIVEFHIYREREFDIGESVMWESGGVIQWDKPKNIKSIEKDDKTNKFYVIVEGSSTGIPMDEISRYFEEGSRGPLDSIDEDEVEEESIDVEDESSEENAKEVEEDKEDIKDDVDMLSSIIGEMSDIVDKKRLQNLKMFRVATFILQKYGDPEKLRKVLRIKNKEQRRNTYREIMLESWKEFAIHKKPDLDCHGILFLLNAAGFEINNVSVMDKGNIKGDTVNFDIGNVHGLETYKHKNSDNTTKYDYAVIDHHGKTLDIESSSTKYLYEFLTTLGFIEDRTGYLKAIVDFIVREDNKDYNFTEDDYRNSASNLLGYSGYITEENLTKLLNDQDLKDKYLEISNVKDNLNIESMYLSNNELKRLGLFEYKKNRLYAIAKTIDSMKKLEEKDEKLKAEKKEGLIYNIDKYKVLINENYIIKFATDIAIAKGYNVVINYSGTNNKFSASFLKSNMPELSKEFKEKMEEYGIINIRNAMLIKDVKNEKAKPIDKDFIYGPNGLINELKK